jgi:predicted DNA-binding protein
MATETETVTVSADLPGPLYERLRAAAAAEDRSMASILRRLVAAYLDSQEPIK